MKRLILFHCLVPLIASSAVTQKYSTPSTNDPAKQEQITKKLSSSDQAIDLIAKLPEVKEERAHFFKVTKRHILLTLENDPKKDGYYSIGVVQDMADHYFHLWYFKVDSKTHAISFWDIPSDTMIPYAKWSKSRQRK
jgi:hypothetical protein